MFFFYITQFFYFKNPVYLNSSSQYLLDENLTTYLRIYILTHYICFRMYMSRFMDLCAHSVFVYVVDLLVVLVSVA